MEAELRCIIAPPEATLEDVSKIMVEGFKGETNPPAHVVGEAIGRDPQGNSVWIIEVKDDPETPQEAPGGDDSPTLGSDVPPDEGGS